MLRFVGLVPGLGLVGTSFPTSVAAAAPQGVARDARIGEPSAILSRPSDSTIAHDDSATVTWFCGGWVGARMSSYL